MTAGLNDRSLGGQEVRRGAPQGRACGRLRAVNPAGSRPLNEAPTTDYPLRWPPIIGTKKPTHTAR